MYRFKVPTFKGTKFVKLQVMELQNPCISCNNKCQKLEFDN